MLYISLSRCSQIVYKLKINWPFQRIHCTLNTIHSSAGLGCSVWVFHQQYFVPPKRQNETKSKNRRLDTSVIFMYIYLQAFSKWRCYINNRKMTVCYPKTSSIFIISGEYMSVGAILQIMCKSHSRRLSLYSWEAALLPCCVRKRTASIRVWLSNIQMWFHLLVGLLLDTELTQIHTGPLLISAVD